MLAGNRRSFQHDHVHPTTIATALTLAIAACAMLTACASTHAPLPARAPVNDRQAATADAAASLAEAALISGDRAALDAALREALTADPTHWRANAAALIAAQLDVDANRVLEHALNALTTDTRDNEWILFELEQTHLDRPSRERLLAALTAYAPITRYNTVRARADAIRITLLRSLSRIDDADELSSQQGALKNYFIIGGFENSQNSGFPRPYPPEESIDFTREYEGKRWPIRWREGHFTAPDGTLRFANFIDPWRWSVAYALTAIDAAEPVDALLLFSAADDVKLFVNKVERLRDEGNQGASLDSYAVPIRLTRGTNHLLFKVAQRTGPWLLRARIVAPDGSPLAPNTLTFARTFADVRPHARAAAKSPVPQPDALPLHLAPPNCGTDLLCRYRTIRMKYAHGLRRDAIADAEKLLVESAAQFAPLKVTLHRAYIAEDNPGRAIETLRGLLDAQPRNHAAHLALARYYLEADRPDLALEQIDAILADNPNHLAALRARFDYLIDRDFTMEADDLARALVAQAPSDALSYELLARSQRALGYENTYREAVKRVVALDAADIGALSDLASDAETRERYDEAQAFRDRIATLWPLRPDNDIKRAELLLRQRRFDDAERATRAALALSPDYWRAYDLLGDIHRRAGRTDDAIVAWKKSLALKPDAHERRAYLDYLAPEKDALFARYRIPRAEVEALINADPIGDEPDNAASVTLLDYAVTRVNKDGSSRELVHRIIRLLNDTGVRRYNQVSIPATPTLRLLRALAHTPDQRIVEATSIDRGVIRFPELATGTTIEYEYEFDKSNNGWLDEHYYSTFYFQDRAPIRLSRWILALPHARALKHSTHPLVTLATSRFLDFDIYDFKAVNAPRIEDDPRAPPLHDLAARIDVSTVPSWNIMADWQNGLIKDQFEINAPIREKIRALTASATTPMQKLEAIYDFIVSDIRYLYADVGIFGKKPDLCVNIFSNRFGDCKDKATLMIAMLREVGITAHYAGVRTRNYGTINRDIPSAQTNHVITFVPAQPGIDRDLFLDGTAQFHSVSALPYADQGIDAFVLDGKGYRYVATPVLDPSETLNDYTIETRLAADGSATMREVFTGTGGNAARMRSLLNDTSQQQTRIERMLTSAFKGATLLTSRVDGLASIRDDVTITTEFTAPTVARPLDDNLLVRPSRPARPAQTFASSALRHYPLELGQPSIYRYRETFIPPPGMRFATVPKETHIASEAYRFTARAFMLTDGSVTIEHEHVIAKPRIELADYAAFRDQCVRIEAFENTDLRLIPDTRPDTRLSVTSARSAPAP